MLDFFDVSEFVDLGCPRTMYLFCMHADGNLNVPYDYVERGFTLPVTPFCMVILSALET